MKMTFKKKLYYYYSSIIVLMFSLLSAGAYYFWFKGPMDTEMLQELYESAQVITSMKNDLSPGQIKDLVLADRSRQALERLTILEDQINKIKSTTSLKDSSSFDNLLGRYKASLNGLISSPDIKKVLQVLSSKVNKFNQLTTERRWPTLNRISKRSLERLEQSSTKLNVMLSSQKFEETISGLNADVSRAKKITEGSVLPSADKSLILNFLESFLTEIKMLAEFDQRFAGFNKVSEEFTLSYQNFVQNAELSIAEMKMEFQNFSKKLFFGLMALIASLFPAFMVGRYLQNADKVANVKSVESFTLDMIKKGILAHDENLNLEHLDANFAQGLQKYRDYTQKRISYGMIFQDALPLSSIMLDANLNLIWANSLFFEQWNLHDLKNRDEAITWDYLQTFTNLGEDGPIFQALRHQISGIYQIQVRAEGAVEACPYEMYVSPVEYQGMTRIMMFFYPLRSLQETIANQTLSIVGPISRLLDLLINDNLTTEISSKLKNDFSVSGISHLYDKFLSYNELVFSQKNVLMNEIENLENELCDKYKTINDLSHCAQEGQHLNHSIMDDFTQIKQTLVELSDSKSSIEKVLANLLIGGQILKKQNSSLSLSLEQLWNNVEENIVIVNGLAFLRKDLKSAKAQVEAFKSDLILALDKIILAHKSNKTGVGSDSSLTELKSKVRDMESNFSDLSKVVTSLDVGLSKAEMVLGEFKRPEAQDANNLKGIEDLFVDQYDKQKLCFKYDEKELCLIEELKHMVSTFKKSHIVLNKMNNLVAGSVAQTTVNNVIENVEANKLEEIDIAKQNIHSASSPVASYDQLSEGV